jgi:hypothetical protein
MKDSNKLIIHPLLDSIDPKYHTHRFHNQTICLAIKNDYMYIRLQ